MVFCVMVFGIWLMKSTTKMPLLMPFLKTFCPDMADVSDLPLEFFHKYINYKSSFSLMKLQTFCQLRAVVIILSFNSVKSCSVKKQISLTFGFHSDSRFSFLRNNIWWNVFDLKILARIIMLKLSHWQEFRKLYNSKRNPCRKHFMSINFRFRNFIFWLFSGNYCLYLREKYRFDLKICT